MGMAGLANFRFNTHAATTKIYNIRWVTGHLVTNSTKSKIAKKQRIRMVVVSPVRCSFMKFYSFSTFHRKRKTKPLAISTEGMITSQTLARKNVILSCVSRSTAGANQRTKTVNKFSSRTLFYGSQQYFDSTCGNVNIVCKGKTKFYSFFMSHFLDMFTRWMMCLL